MNRNRLEHIDADLKRYLLGQLREDEQVAIEQRVFASDDSHEELLAIEEDLIDAYVGSELSAEDRAQFESHFLSSERRVQKVATARALAAGIEAAVRETTQRESLPRRLGWLVAAASLVVVTVGWFALRSDREPPPDPPADTPAASPGQPTPPAVIPASPAEGSAKSNAAPSSQSPASSGQPSPVAPAARAPSVVALTLMPGASRDIAGGARLVLPPNTDVVLVEVRFEPADYRSYTSVLRTVNERVVRTDDKLQAKRVGNQMTVTLRWPAAQLEADDYLLSVTGITTSGEREEIADYYFRVVRPAPGP